MSEDALNPHAPSEDPRPAEPETFPLDDAAIETLQELDRQLLIHSTMRNTVLGFFVRQHKLPGQWQLAPNGRELVKQE